MGDVIDEGTNMAWFRPERAMRPLMERVCEVEPDVREVLLAADGLGLAVPAADLRDRVDEETARHIAEKVLPLTPSERLLLLDGLVAPVAGAALRACAEAARASVRCAAAVGEVDQARREGGHWMEPFEERAEVAALEAGRLLVAAYGRCQEAHGVARAVGLARRGEPWTPVGEAADRAGRDGPVAPCPAGRAALGVSP